LFRKKHKNLENKIPKTPEILAFFHPEKEKSFA
jgi:hypothetical protein